MYIEVQDKKNIITYINSEQICSLQFNRKEFQVQVVLSSGETVTVDYNILFTYPARKTNYRAYMIFQKLAGLLPSKTSANFAEEGTENGTESEN